MAKKLNHITSIVHNTLTMWQISSLGEGVTPPPSLTINICKKNWPFFIWNMVLWFIDTFFLMVKGLQNAFSMHCLGVKACKNVLTQRLNENCSSSMSWESLCRIRVPPWLKHLSHCAHWYGFSPVWTLLWVFSLSIWLKYFSQISRSCGFAAISSTIQLFFCLLLLVCTLACERRSEGRVKVFTRVGSC